MSNSSATLAYLSSCLAAIVACCFSCLMAILVHQSLYFLANPSHSWTSSHSSWALVQVMFCGHVRAKLRLDPSSVCELSFWWRKNGREELTVVWDLTGGDLPQSFPTTLPEGWDRPLGLYLLLQAARQLVLGNRRAATKDTGDLRGIRLLMCLMKEGLCPGKGSWKIP